MSNVPVTEQLQLPYSARETERTVERMAAERQSARLAERAQRQREQDLRALEASCKATDAMVRAMVTPIAGTPAVTLDKILAATQEADRQHAAEEVRIALAYHVATEGTGGAQSEENNKVTGAGHAAGTNQVRVDISEDGDEMATDEILRDDEILATGTDGTLPRNELQPDAIEEDEGNDTPQQQQETRAPDTAQSDASEKGEFIGKLQDTLKNAIAKMGTKLGKVVASLAEREQTRTDAKLDEIQARITEFAQREAGRAKTTSAKLDSLLASEAKSGTRLQPPSLSKQASGQREAPTLQQTPPSPRREVCDDVPGMFSHISNGIDCHGTNWHQP